MKYLNIILYILLVPFEAMSSVLFATLLQPVIDTGINKNTEAFIQMFSLLFIVSIGNLVLNYATGYFFIKVIANNKASLKNTYLTAILNKKPSEFYKKDTGYYVVAQETAEGQYDIPEQLEGYVESEEEATIFVTHPTTGTISITGLDVGNYEIIEINNPNYGYLVNTQKNDSNIKSLIITILI